MPQLVNDAIISQVLNLSRLDATSKREVLRILRRMRSELLAELSTGTISQWRRERLERALREANAIIEAAYEEADEYLANVLKGVAEITARKTAGAISASLVQIDAVLPSATMLETLATSALIDGATLGQWWEQQSQTTKFKFANAVRQGIAQGESNGQIVSRVRDVIDVAGREAQTLVQTATSAVSNKAREAVYEKNSDVLKGMRWLATLDSHTCPRCGALDGLMWDMDGKPIGHSTPFTRPPLHFNDRCVLSPVTKTYKELGIDLPEPTAGKRASEFGTESGKTTFSAWLKRQSPEYIEEVLGKGRAELWRAGKISLADLTSGTGRPLTLEELE